MRASTTELRHIFFGKGARDFFILNFFFVGEQRHDRAGRVRALLVCEQNAADTALPRP
jgi:hypothetical protein